MRTVEAVSFRTEQILAQYRSMPVTFVGSAAVASILAAMLYSTVGTHVLAVWLTAVYLLSAARYLLWRQFNRVAPGSERIAGWGRLAIASAGLSGLIWGTGGLVLHVPGNLPYQLFVLISIVGLGFTSMYLTAQLMPAFLAFVCPSFVLSAIPFLMGGDRTHVGIGVATLLFLPLVAQYAAHVCRTFLDSVSVRIRNAQLVEELRDQMQAAEEANVAKSRFLAVASHDLRQPLHALGLFVQALQESSIALHERQIVEDIRRSVGTLEELFDALLDISRLDAGIVRPRLETFSLASIFDRLRFEFDPAAQGKGLSLRVAPTSVHVCSDPSLLVRIVRNLLSNALRYTDRGGLLLGCRRQGERLRIEVWDTGRGIPLDKQSEIFREFVQLDCSHDADRDHRVGLGLGLAIVERLAQLLGHDVQLHSRPGRGSVFAVTLPRGRAEDSMAHLPVEISTVFDLTGTLILVIDSDRAVRQAMEALLGKWNCEVISAASGPGMKERLARVSRVPDLIISDYKAAGSGEQIAVIEMLRNEFNTDIPALLLTGDSAPGQLCAHEIGGLPILRKPLNPARLRTLIANLLRVDESRQRRAS